MEGEGWREEGGGREQPNEVNRERRKEGEREKRQGRR